MRWTAIVNPAAGRRRARDRVALTTAALRTADVDATVAVSTSAADAVRLAEKAFADGHGVIACGGDGTVAALAGVAADRHGAFALLPLGSGNDFARAVGIGHDLDFAARAVRRERTALVDLGRATGADGTSAWFTTVANAGFDAEANQWANGVRALSGSPLYVAAALRTLAVYRPRVFRLRVDDEARDCRAWFVAVANTAYYGGGMAIAPDASYDDGRLDVCVVAATSTIELLRAFPRVFRGTHVDHPAVTITRATRVTIETLDGPGDVWASGERVGPLAATVEVVPRVLRLVVP